MNSSKLTLYIDKYCQRNINDFLNILYQSHGEKDWCAEYPDIIQKVWNETKEFYDISVKIDENNIVSNEMLMYWLIFTFRKYFKYKENLKNSLGLLIVTSSINEDFFDS